MIDTHAHLNDEKLFENRKEIIENAKIAGVEAIICTGYDLQSSILALQVANEEKNVYAQIGIHPHEANSFNSKTEAQLKMMAQNKKVVAIGEIGLDFFYDFSSREKQIEVFESQIMLAKELCLPISIHTRNAMEETIEILLKHKKDIVKESVIHCFDGNIAQAQVLTQNNFVLSFGGMVTFKNKEELLNVIKNIDKNKILLETDCPYLTPVPYRKFVNEPKYLRVICEKIAFALNESVDNIDKLTSKNAKRIFNI